MQKFYEAFLTPGDVLFHYLHMEVGLGPSQSGCKSVPVGKPKIPRPDRAMLGCTICAQMLQMLLSISRYRLVGFIFSTKFLCSVNIEQFKFSPHGCIWLFSFPGHFMNKGSHWGDISCCLCCYASQEHLSWDRWKTSLRTISSFSFKEISTGIGASPRDSPLTASLAWKTRISRANTAPGVK